jgi:hypothetical protein
MDLPGRWVHADPDWPEPQSRADGGDRLELVLEPDGQASFMFASGTWKKEGGEVVLTYSEPYPTLERGYRMAKREAGKTVVRFKIDEGRKRLLLTLQNPSMSEPYTTFYEKRGD